MNISIIGTGKFSIAIAMNLSWNKNNKIILWSENESLVKDYQKTKKIKNLYDVKPLPKNVLITNDLNEALEDSKIVFMLTSINYVEEMAIKIKNLIDKKALVITGSKGVNLNGKFAYEVLKKNLKNNILIISGPNLDKDILNGNLIGIDVYAKSKKHFKKLQSIFNPNNIILKHSSDEIGMYLSGVLKNIYAIGSGIFDNSSSTNALYLTLVYNELYEILFKYNSSLETLHSLSCLGDLIATCTSKTSRNYQYGVLISKKNSKKDLKKYIEENTIEGVNSIELTYKILKKKKIKTPILNCLYNIVINEENPNTLEETIKKI